MIRKNIYKIREADILSASFLYKIYHRLNFIYKFAINTEKHESVVYSC